jgi:PREDICTED: similar to crossveinless CG12410-PA
MCPKPNLTDSQLSSKSHIEDLPESSAELFNALTEEKDSLMRWTSFTFPIRLTFIVLGTEDQKEIKFGAGIKVTMRSDGFDQEEDVQVQSG